METVEGRTFVDQRRETHPRDGQQSEDHGDDRVDPAHGLAAVSYTHLDVYKRQRRIVGRNHRGAFAESVDAQMLVGNMRGLHVGIPVAAALQMCIRDRPSLLRIMPAMT